jgi:phosphoribosyl 1,2-cyclic phosphodiesterase/ActR/RegA family two-component response regulator
MKTILLIDDDEMCRRPAADLLRRHHWQVFEAEDGEKGMDMAVQHRPDVILCDLLMPRLNGYQVCRAVREHLELRHTKIIVVTGRDYASDRKSAEEAGADGYLVKPLEFSTLNEILGRILPSALIADGDERDPRPAPGGTSDQTTLRFWGVRGSIPAPGETTTYYGGNTSCVELRCDGQIIILDAGSGIRPLGMALMKEFGEAPIDATVLITHTHWDHIQGFPFFIPAYDSRNRFQIFGYEGARSGLHTALAGQMESPYFPVALDEMPGNLRIQELREMQFRLGSLKVEACFTNHPGVCVAYKLHTPHGAIVYMPDNETKRGRKSGENGALVPDPSEKMLVDFLRDADVAIVDSQYTADEYERHVDWGHGCIDEVVRLAIAAGVKRLFTFHHDPAHNDALITKMVEHARQLAQRQGASLTIEAAREGAEVLLRSGALAASC